MPTADPIHQHAVARAILESLDGDRIVLRLPHTDYRLKLAVDDATAAALRGRIGQRVAGTIEAESLRIHAAGGGGRFIEPVIGEPRIVAGEVLAADEAAGRVVIRTAVPMRLATQEGQDFSVIQPGGLVNCHVRSGARFTAERD